METKLDLADEFKYMLPFVVVSSLRPESVVADVVIYVSSDGRSATELQQQVSDALTVIAQSSDGLLNISQVTVSSPLICYPSKWSTEYGVVSFGQGELGSMMSSTNICPYYTSNAGQRIATAMCSGDRISQAQWEPSENCGEITRPISRVLADVQGDISEETADEASSIVANVTKDTPLITARDINTIANITTVIANLNIGNPKVTENFVTIVSNVAAVENSQLERAEEESNAISDIVIAFEQQLMNTDVEDGAALDVAEENVVVQVTSVPPDRLQGGVVLTVQGEDVSDLSQSEIRFNTTGGISGSEDVIAQSVIPPDIVGTVTPVPAGTNQTNSSSENMRVIMSLYSTPSLFISQSVLRFNRQSMLVDRSANTPVISLSIGESKLENLAEPITLTFIALKGGKTNQTCVSWDFLTSDWSTDGCILVNVTEEFNLPSAPATNGEEYYACSCNHLTNFAILMDIRQRESPRAFGILSYIGCAVSIVGLVLTLATYLWNKKLRNRQSHRIFICLCATLLGFYVTYVVMISLDSGLSEANPIPCSVLAALVQFFMLSSIAWMGVEGYNTYLIVVRVFNTYVPYYLLKASIVAWGIPAVVVGVTGGIARNDYVRDNLCFPDLWSQVGGLLIPVAVILLINVIIFILVIRQLALSANVSGKVRKDKQAERRETIERVQNAITILVLLGLTWIIGYLLLLDVFVDVIQTLFIVFNSFQGLFIFLLYCVRKPIVRKQWGLACATRGGATDDGSSSEMRRRSNPTPASTSSMSPATDTRADSQNFSS
ncbi:adhesion G-protein coupled receptor G7-like [Diadema setosum]|uniref:adhesion G-protein coupled receptor G7-like n=1 Tax=Diadema setosum TaxID=31175 RepID=UPI003B3B0170